MNKEFIFLLIPIVLAILLAIILIKNRKADNQSWRESWFQFLRRSTRKPESPQIEPELEDEQPGSELESTTERPEAEAYQSGFDQFQDEQIRLPQLVWGEKEKSDQPFYENFVEGRFSHLLAIAIQGMVDSGTPSISAIETALGTRNNYHQAAKYFDYMIDAGVIAEKPNGDREIAITPGQARCIIFPKLMAYPAGWSVSQVIAQLKTDIFDMRSDFWSEIDTMSGQEFENWCAVLLKKLGYDDIEVTKGSGDQGVDILAAKDEVPYAFQCKCYASDLGNSPVQEVYAGLRYYHRNVGVVITNRYFTQGAKDLARATDVLLWDRDRLKRMMSAAGKQPLKRS